MTLAESPQEADMDAGDDARHRAARTRPDRVPDSAAAAEAEGLARAESSPMLYGHALRTYFFAALLAAQDGMRYDEELLYVGCVLHTVRRKTHRLRRRPAQCRGFTRPTPNSATWSGRTPLLQGRGWRVSLGA